METTLEEAWKNKNYRKILNAASKYQTLLDDEELESLQMITLWKAMQKYDKKHKTKFTSYLYDQMRFAILTLYKKFKKNNLNFFYTDNLISYDHSFESSKAHIELQADLSEDEYELVKMKFIDKMNYREIGEKLHTGPKTVKKTIDKIVNKLRRVEY